MVPSFLVLSSYRFQSVSQQVFSLLCTAIDNGLAVFRLLSPALFLYLSQSNLFVFMFPLLSAAAAAASPPKRRVLLYCKKTAQNITVQKRQIECNARRLRSVVCLYFFFFLFSFFHQLLCSVTFAAAAAATTKNYTDISTSTSTKKRNTD